MPAAARGDSQDVVASKTGTGPNCALPVTTSTDECSPNVFTNGIGSVREGDKVAPHPFVGCGNDGSVLTTFSPNVFVNGKGFGRLGDQYTSDNTITTGSSNVFVNG
jgi:uncharacterized Zn-binding protein involved in type VI secretion